MPEAEIIDGLVMCPVCGYFQEAEPGEMVCQNSEEDEHIFRAVQKDAAP
jgi:uncharacterized Zn finger protein (UPF0148 family)